jgi:hypothetical protein
MAGILFGVIIIGIGGFFLKIKKNKKIGSLCLIPGVLILGISMIIIGLDGGSGGSSNGAAASSGLSNSSKGAGTAEKPEHFRYDLNEEGTGVIITGLLLENPVSIKFPKEIEGYPVVEISLSRENGPDVASVSIPDTVTTIGNMAFIGRETLRSIILPKNLKIIGHRAFYGSGLTSVIIPEGVTYIAAYAFGLCPNLSSVTLPESLEEIGDQAFVSCPELTTVNLPSHNIKYGSSVFVNCPKLSLGTRRAINDTGYGNFF